MDNNDRTPGLNNELSPKKKIDQKWRSVRNVAAEG